jgi:hypothetical protein
MGPVSVLYRRDPGHVARHGSALRRAGPPTTQSSRGCSGASCSRGSTLYKGTRARHLGRGIRPQPTGPASKAHTVPRRSNRRACDHHDLHRTRQLQIAHSVSSSFGTGVHLDLLHTPPSRGLTLACARDSDGRTRGELGSRIWPNSSSVFAGSPRVGAGSGRRHAQSQWCPA